MQKWMKKPTMVKWHESLKTNSFVKKQLRGLFTYIRPIESVSCCKYTLTKFVPFGKFYTVLNQLFKLSLTKAAIHTTIAYAIIFYYFTIYSISTTAVDYLSRTGTKFKLPVYLTVLIIKIGMRVRTTNKLDGSVTGSTVCDTSIADIFHKLLNITHTEYLDIIKDSPFSSANSSKDFFSVRDKILAILTGSYATDQEGKFQTGDADELHFIMFSTFVYFPSLFHSSDRSVDCIEFSLDRSVSSFINIHRFRNSEFENCFVVNSHSIASINSGTQDEFAAFLRLFSPDFVQGSGTGSSLKDILPNDVLFDLSNLTSESCLELLFKLARADGSNNRNSFKPGNPDSKHGPRAGKTPGFKLNKSTYNKSRKPEEASDIDIEALSKFVSSIIYSILQRSQTNTDDINSIEVNGVPFYYKSFSKQPMHYRVVVPDYSFEPVIEYQ